MESCTLCDFQSLDSMQMARMEQALSGNVEVIARALQKDEPTTCPPAKALVDFARIFLQKEDSHLFLTSCAVRGERGWRFLFGCTFFRAIDNVADSTAPSNQQDHLIERYLELASETADPRNICPADVFELMILTYMILDREGTPRTRDCLYDIILSLRLDLDRRHRILSWTEYETLNYYRAVRPMEAFFRLLLERDDEITREMARQLGTFAIYIDDIRDLKSDLALGFINITREELDDLHVTGIEAMMTSDWEQFVANRNSLLLVQAQACLQLVEQPEAAPARTVVAAVVRAAMSTIVDGGFQVDQAERWSIDLVQKLMGEEKRRGQHL